MAIEPVNRIIDSVVEAFGKIDILVNNAGIIRRADALEFSEKDWDEVMDINLYKFMGSGFTSSQNIKEERKKIGSIIEK